MSGLENTLLDRFLAASRTLQISHTSGPHNTEVIIQPLESATLRALTRTKTKEWTSKAAITEPTMAAMMLHDNSESDACVMLAVALVAGVVGAGYGAMG